MGIRTGLPTSGTLWRGLGLMVLLAALAGCAETDSGVACRTTLQVAQLNAPPDLGPLPKGILEADRAGARQRKQVYARFAEGVMLRLRSDRYRMLAEGRRIPQDASKGLLPKDLYKQADELWSQAVKAFQEVLRRDPTAERAAFQLAMGYLDRRRFDEGLRYLKLACELDPRDFELQYEMGSWLERFERRKEAVDHYQAARKSRAGLAKQRMLPIVLLKLATLLERSDRMDEAAEVYEAFLNVERGPDSLYRGNPALLKLLSNRGPVLRRLGQLATRSGDSAKAIRYLKKALEEEPDHTSTRLLLAQAYVNAGDLKLAEQTATEYIEVEPDAPEGYRFLITLYEHQNRLKQAIATTKALLERQPELYQMRFLLGGMYERSGNKDLAIACYRIIVKERRRYLPVYLKLGRLYHEDGKDAEALWVYSEALMSGLEDGSVYAAAERVVVSSKEPQKLAERMRTVLPEADRSHTYYSLLALVHHGAGQSERAVEALEKALQLNASFTQGYLRLAWLYAELDKSDKAIEVLKRAEANGVRNFAVFRSMGELLARDGRLDEAAAQLEKANQLSPWQYDTTLRLADVYRELKNPGRAEELLKGGLEANPDDAAKWMFALGIFYTSEGSAKNLARGIEILENYAELTPDDPSVLRVLSLAYLRLKDYDRATLRAEQLVRLNNKELEPRLLLAGIHEETHRLKEAESVLREAMGQFRASPESARELGRFLLAHRRKTAEGILLLERAAAKAPEDVQTQTLLGWGYEKLKRYDQAVKVLKRTRGLAPDNDRVVYTLGVVYQAMGAHDKAEAELRAMLLKDPEDPLANNALGYFFAETSRNLDEAARLIRKALEVEPDNGAYLDSLGWVYYRQGKLPEALKLLEDAFAKEADGVIAEHIGDVLYRLDRAKEAGDYWRRASELDPWLDSADERLRLLKKGKNPLGEN